MRRWAWLLCVAFACKESEKGADVSGGDDDPGAGAEPADNKPPTAPEVAIAPSSPTAADDLEVQFIFEAEDPDGDDVRYEYAWLRDGELVDALTDDTVPASELRRGEVWEVRVRAKDPWISGPSADDEVTVGNAPPTVEPEFVDATPTAARDLLVDPHADDPDGDEVTVSYVWKSNGAVQPYTGPRVPKEVLARGQTWRVSVEPSDGDLVGETRELVVEIGNSTPTVSVAFASPNPSVCQPLVCEVTAGAFDADGDPVTVSIAWTVNGSPYLGLLQNTNRAGDTIPTNELADGQTWGCSAIATDGLDASAPVQAVATVSGSQITDSFTMRAPPEVDLLVVVDDSGSMAEEQRKLTDGFTELMSSIQLQGLDYHIGVVTTDTDAATAGRLRTGGAGRYIDTTVPDPVAAFEAMATVGIGGSSDERGLRASYLALTAPLVNGYNAGFLRASADLAVLVLSDERDYSLNNPSVPDYASFLQLLKVDPEMVSFHALVGPAPGGCGTAENGVEYHDVRELVGGYEASICDRDYGPFLTSVANYVGGSRQYLELSANPGGVVAGTLIPQGGAATVLVEGRDFERAGRVIRMVAAPPAGATVRFSYDFTCP